tara:strand:+ start:733 stop:2082 length:1350 start_codon:yes stop_codon:yes gene_type:complete
MFHLKNAITPKSILKRSLLFASIWPCALSYSAETPLLPENRMPELAAILKAARIHAPDLIEQELIREEAEARLKQAKSAYYPRLGVVTNLGYEKDYRDEGQEDTDNFGVTYMMALRRPIYHWGAIEAKVEQARIDNNSDQLTYLKNLQQIERNIRADYLTIILNNIALRNERAKQAILEGRNETTRIKFETGAISKLDYDRSQIDLAQSLLKIDRIAQSKKRIAERFQYLAGWENPTTSIAEIAPIDLNETEAWLEQQQTQLHGSSWTYTTYSAARQINSIEHEKEEIIKIKARQRPLIDASATAKQGQSNTSNKNNVDTFSVFAGIRITWNIFDGFNTKNAQIEAQAKVRRLEQELKQLSKELQMEASEVLDSLLFQVRNLRLIQAQHATEEAQYRLEEGNTTSGRSTNLTLQDAALGLKTEEFAMHQARADLLMGLSDYYDLVTPIR